MVVANATTNWLFDTNLPTFLTGKNIAGGFGANGANNSWEITVPELFNLALGGSGGISSKTFPDGLMGAVKRNLRTNTLRQGAVILGAPLAFRLGKQFLAKPVIRPANKLLKSVGIKEVKV